MARRRRRVAYAAQGRSFKAPTPKSLLKSTDYGPPLRITPEQFVPAQRGGGWGPFAEAFARMNQSACDSLDVRIEIGADTTGPVIKLIPGGRIGAIPLVSPQTGHVNGGYVVTPRFGWAGVGHVLSATGWAASPQFLSLSLVPGSGREVPPWVMAGPVLTRLAALLRSMRRGYHEVDAVLERPRGRILWQEYISGNLVRGNWGKLPCRFQELEIDPRLRSHIRWTLERIHNGLVSVGGRDPIAVALADWALKLLEMLGAVQPVQPRTVELDRLLSGQRLLTEALRSGLQAIAWIVEERGLGGGQEQDGLAWMLPLDQLWEAYAEAVVRQEAAIVGGEVKVARRRETTFPLEWSDAFYRSLGHLAPDVVVRGGDWLWIVDAKYKAHLAEMDEAGWHQIQEETKASHRADLHQILAYAGLYDATSIRATLVYPLRHSTWQALRVRGRDISRAQLHCGGRDLTLELRGLPFGDRGPL